MPYYAKTAVYYRGDPGFLGKLVGGALKGVAGFVTGGPVGALAGVASSFLGKAGPQPVAPTVQMPRYTPTAMAPTAPGAAVPARGPIPIGSVQMKPAGYHINKTSYFLKSGQFIPAGTVYVRNRRRNMANGRALNRAITRAKGFDRLVKRNRAALRSLARI